MVLRILPKAREERRIRVNFIFTTSPVLVMARTILKINGVTGNWRTIGVGPIGPSPTYRRLQENPLLKIVKREYLFLKMKNSHWIFIWIGCPRMNLSLIV